MKIKKNGKIITLSESDLKRIVKRVLREEDADPKEDLIKCCSEAGIKPPQSCVSGDHKKCIEEVGKMVINDPLGTGMKAINALNCLKEKGESPVMN